MSDHAAALTYYSLMSLFPALLFGVALLGLFGQETLIPDTTDYLKSAGAPSETVDAVTSALDSAQSQRDTAITALVFGLVLALNSASGAFGAVGRALNQAWRVDEGRGFVRRKANDLLWTLVVIVLVLITCVLLFLGGGLAADVLGWLGLGDTAADVWRYARWPGALVSAMLVYAVVYYAAPNVEVRRFQWITPGRRLRRADVDRRLGAVLPLRLELLVLFGDIRRVRRGRDPARLALADERRAAVRRGAQRRDRRAPLAGAAA